MAGKVSFDGDWDEGESEVDTLDGAVHSSGDPAALSGRQLYAQHRTMTRADGTPVVSGPTAQDLLNQQTQREQWLASHPEQARRLQQRQNYQDQAVDQAVESFVEQRADDQALMSEAEYRFDKAKYYKLLLGKDSLFDNSSDAGREVDAEIRAFARERFEVFLGIRQERGAVPAVFEGWTPEDFTALLQLVRRIQQKPELAASQAPRPEPSITPVKTAPAPVTTLAPSLVRAEPSLRTPQGSPLEVPLRRPAEQPPRPRRPPPGNPQGRVTQNLVDPYTGTLKVDASGRPLQQDITPQVRPAPNAPVQPVPMPMGKSAIEQIYASKAIESAAVDAGNLDRRLSAASKGTGFRLRLADIGSQVGGTTGEIVSEGADYVPDPSLMR